MDRRKAEVEKFLRRYFDLEISISPEARTLPMKSGQPFADCLQQAIIDYMTTTPLTESETLSSTGVALFGDITRAYSYGLISSGSDLLERLDEIRQQNRGLTKDLAICVANYKALEDKHERLIKNLSPDKADSWKEEEEQP